ncbi:hypothetical protein [Actinoplanes sp. NPDC051494]|uniref:hypothetical protein n=1 Tax=Actinoplanes sp. NPDC051494 TaxID=3363907 RepID=UPI00379D2CFB
MTIRHFNVQAPRADFRGELSGIQFADGQALVSFDDASDSEFSPGVTVGENQIQAGRALVIFARRQYLRGWRVAEVDAAGQPLHVAEAS